MKFIYAIILLFTINNLSFSQKYELGKVTLEELNEKVHPKDATAEAAILFEKGRTYFEYKQGEGFSVLTDVEIKIKVYTKEGYSWADRYISYYVGGDDDESVSISKAITYNSVDGKIEKTKLKSEGEFSEKVNKFWSRKKITLPNVKEGSILEYKYTIKSPYISTFPVWNFQTSIPVNHSEYSTYVPEYFVYNVYRKGFNAINETKTSETKTISLNYRERQVGAMGTITSSSVQTDNINYTENVTNFSLENVSALKDENFVNNIENYTSSVQHELSSKRIPNSPFEMPSNSWEDVAKKIFENEDFGNQLNKNNYYENDITTLITGLTSNEEKINVIFKFVKSKMNWNEYLGYLCDVGVKKAFQDKVGNAAEINLMLVSMLKFAGLDANPILISTRDNGIALYPSRTAFNNVIASVKLNDNVILLDATNKNALPNILPFRDLNWFGRIIKKDGASEFLELTPKTNSTDIVNVMATVNDKGEVEGKVRENYKDYYALQYRDRYENVTKDAYLEILEKQYKTIEIDNYEVTNNILENEAIVEKFSFKSNSIVEKIGDKLFFSPLLYLSPSENPFNQENREYPVDFSFPFKDKQTLIIAIPDGYAVESLPKPIAIAMDNNYGNFSYTISNTEKQIQVASTFDVNTAIIPAEDYPFLKEFYKIMIEKQNEKVVLKKL